MFQRKKISLPDPKKMAAALADIRDVQARHDVRVMWLVLLDRTALVARQLKLLKMETDESVEEMFKAALEQSKKPMPRTLTTFDPEAKNKANPS